MQTEKFLFATFILMASCGILLLKDFSKSRRVIFYPIQTLSEVQIPLDPPLSEAQVPLIYAQPLWVGVHFAGRLGNQMFQTASCYGVASARDAQCCLFDFDNSMLQEAIEMLEPFQKCPHEFEQQKEGKHNQRFVASLMDSSKTNTTIGDYLQSWLYFQYRTPPFLLRERHWAREWTKSRGINTGIHVRRGDIGESFQANYFEKAIAKLRTIETGALVFVVVTEDPGWVRAQPVFSGMTISEGHSPGQDMAILAACKDIIISVGTFGWWAAYLRENTNGTVVHYEAKWETANEESHNPLHFYPQDWIGIKYDLTDPCTICSAEHMERVNRMEMQNTPDPYQQHLNAVLNGCGEICDLSMTGQPSLFFNYIQKNFDCLALGTNAAIDASGWDSPPPNEIPASMRSAFTFDGRIQPSGYYLHQKYLDSTAAMPIWTREGIDHMIALAKRLELEGNYGRDETNWVIEGLAQMSLNGTDVLVIGSENPWVEACVLAAGALRVTTLEYGTITSLHPQVFTLTPGELRSQFQSFVGRFDAIVTFSSVEHSGLGRYGDALNPYGDKQAIARAWCLAKPGARMLLGVMYGHDGLEFNAHRVYGPLQLAHLTANWKQVWRAPGGSQLVHVFVK